MGGAAGEPEAGAAAAAPAALLIGLPHGLDLAVEVAHELRSPLTSVLFLSEVLYSGQSGPLTDVQKRQLGIIYSAALGLVGMASDMIEMARGGTGVGGEATPFSVNELLESTRALVRPTAEQKGLELRLCMLEQEHRRGHPLALSRVLLNLAANALKYTQDGWVEIAARGVGGARVEFAVSDTGPGIDDEELALLYQPFRREPSRRTGYYFSGTGLGLAICRQLVHGMGSQLELRTGEGAGTRFSFELELPPAQRL